MKKEKKTKSASKGAKPTSRLQKRKGELLPGFIDRCAETIRQLNEDELKEFIRKHLPRVKLRSMGKEVTNRYRGKTSKLNPVQYSLYDYIINYESYVTEQHKSEVLVAQFNLNASNDIDDMFIHARKHGELLESWNGARYLFLYLWPDLYYDQID